MNPNKHYQHNLLNDSQDSLGNQFIGGMDTSMLSNNMMGQYNTQLYLAKNQTPQQNSKIRTSISNFRKKILF